jgi:phospholipase A1
MPVKHSRLLLCALLPLSNAVFADPVDTALSNCVKIADAKQRLVCYDRVAKASLNIAGPAARDDAAATLATGPVPATGTATQADATATADDATPADAATASTASPAKKIPQTGAVAAPAGFSLADHWELDRDHKRGVFNFRPHMPSYLMITRTAHPNDAPYRPFRDIADLGTDLAHNEAVFQLSFKLKLAENPFDKPVDLWFGYTQNSFWQASNHRASSFFRETNYQPELIAITPLHVNIFGVEARYVGLGVVHQSNGQASTLSRSWNRVVAQIGFERDGLSLQGRIWKRINESAMSDDNRDIVDYMGRGDLTVTYRRNGSDYSALVRHNFSTNRGAVQLSWAFPLAGHFKGYTQLFSGYGQSMIDYNYYQNVAGLGVLGTF